MHTIAKRLADARARALSTDDEVSERAEREAACLQRLDRILSYPEHAELAMDVALRLARDPLEPAEVLRRLGAWAAEREAQGGVERPYTPAEQRTLTAIRVLRGEL